MSCLNNGYLWMGVYPPELTAQGIHADMYGANFSWDEGSKAVCRKNEDGDVEWVVEVSKDAAIREGVLKWWETENPLDK